MKARVSLYLGALMLLIVFAATLGCNKAPNDAQIASDIQIKMSADSGLAGKQLGVQAANGAVTLSGTVDNEAQRAAAARYAASVPGVKQVINDLVVGAASAPPPVLAQTPPPESKPPEPKPSPARRHHRSAPPRENGSVDSSGQMAQNNPPVAAPEPAPAPAPPPPPPPPPPPQKVTIASGTTLAIRLVDAIDSETVTQGQTFHATLDSPLAVDGNVVIPSGYEVEGHVVEVQSAGRFAGKSLLVLQLDRLKAGDSYYNIQTDQYKRQGSSRGTNTAEKVGAGAGIGAIIGAIAGGGKGAAIGAAAGGGLGGGIQAATKGQQIKLPSETVLNFTLQAPISVLPAQSPNSGRQKLGGL